jgi:hypothetical protein
MAQSILKAPVNLYYEVTPIGRILNRFSKDLSAIETQQGWMLGYFMLTVYALI